MYPNYQPYPPTYLKPEPQSDHIYQTLTPSASPHAPYEPGNPFFHHPGNGNYPYPGSFFPANNGSYPGSEQPGAVGSPCVQSPLIDTTTSSPLINPLSNQDESSRATGESDPLQEKSNNVLDNFLDW